MPPISCTSNGRSPSTRFDASRTICRHNKQQRRQEKQQQQRALRQCSGCECCIGAANTGVVCTSRSEHLSAGVKRAAWRQRTPLFACNSWQGMHPLACCPDACSVAWIRVIATVLLMLSDR
jgi:hypothetical protein